MKLGIEWNYEFDGNVEEQARLIKDNGFDATFVSRLDGIDGVMAAIKKYGIVCESYHAPFNRINDMWIAGEDGDIMLSRLCRCIEAGWTAQIVQGKFKEAVGGVLFIDEAYSLVDDRNGSFGDEAINTIVQEMENHRSDVVVIFAGYPDKMNGFLDKNPGLRSRIAFHVPFSDYTSEELCQIADMITKKNGMKLEKEALDKLEKVFDAAKTSMDFGNGRYVRNIFEQAKMNQASRLLEKDFEEITAEEITTIKAEDIVVPDSKKSEIRRIGFC